MYVVFIICLLWLMCGHRCCLVGLGLWGGLGMCITWSWNGEKLVPDSVSYAKSSLYILEPWSSVSLASAMHDGPGRWLVWSCEGRKSV